MSRPIKFRAWDKESNAMLCIFDSENQAEWPLVAWAFLRSPPESRLLRAALAAAGLLTLVVTAWNDNRIAWVALAGMTLLAALLAGMVITPARRARLGLVTAVALAALAALFALSLQNRTEILAGTEREAEAELRHDPRLAIWRFAARRVADSPWVGHGFGRGILRREIRAGPVPGVDNAPYTHGHNSVLNVAMRTLAEPAPRGIGATQSQLEWAINSYTLVFAGLLFSFGVLGMPSKAILTIMNAK